MSLKPVCVPCQRFFRCIKTGFYFMEGMPKGPERPAPGTAQPERWRPYKLWSSDKFRCGSCGAEILSGFGRSPIAIQHGGDFHTLARQLGADQYQVNDC